MRGGRPIIVVLFVMVFGLTFFLFRWRGPSEKHYLIQMDPYGLQGIQIHNESGLFEFEKREGEWYLIQPEDRRAFQKAVHLTIYRLLKLEPVRSISLREENDLSVYGLAPPRISIEIKLKTGEKKKLLLGNENEFGHVYGLLEGQSTLYLFPNITRHHFSPGLLEWIERKWILPPPPEKIRKLEVILLGDRWEVKKEHFPELLPLIGDITLSKLLDREKGSEKEVLLSYGPDFLLRISLESNEVKEYPFFFFGTMVTGTSPFSPQSLATFHPASIRPLLLKLAEMRGFPPLDWWKMKSSSSSTTPERDQW